MILASDPLVDWGALGEALYLSVGIGLAVLVVAAFAVTSSLRAQDQRAEGHGGGVAAMSAVTILCLGVLLATVVTGIYIMTQK